MKKRRLCDNARAQARAPLPLSPPPYTPTPLLLPLFLFHPIPAWSRGATACARQLRSWGGGGKGRTLGLSTAPRGKHVLEQKKKFVKVTKGGARSEGTANSQEKR